VIIVGLVFAPFLVPGARSLNTSAKILIFIALVASYDLLLGYTGIVSFAHTMFLASVPMALQLHQAGWSRAGRRLPWALRLLFYSRCFSRQ
jgi:branched-chain amino acid transport system permease protein